MLDSHLCSGHSLCSSLISSFHRYPQASYWDAVCESLAIPLFASFLGVREPGCRFLLWNLSPPPRSLTISSLCYVGLGPGLSLGPPWCCHIRLSVHGVMNLSIHPLEHISPSSENCPTSTAPPSPPGLFLKSKMAFLCSPSLRILRLRIYPLIESFVWEINMLLVIVSQNTFLRWNVDPRCVSFHPCFGKSQLVISVVTLLTSCLGLCPQHSTGTAVPEVQGSFQCRI